MMNINCSEELYYVISPIILIYLYKGKKKKKIVFVKGDLDVGLINAFCYVKA